MKIVVISDSHGNIDVLNKVLKDNPDADYYFHLGDSELEASELSPFLSIKGNIDYDYSLPMDRVVDTKYGSIYLTHGHAYSGDVNLIAKAAKMNDCSIALYGHTHIYLDETMDGIRVINPSSATRSKDGQNSYVIIYLDDKGIDVKRVAL